MNAAGIITRAQATSVSLRAEGDKLRWRAPALLPPDLGEVLALLRAHKGDVLRAVREGAVTAVTAVTDVTLTGYEREPGAALWRELCEERAAIREHDGGLSRADAEAVALADFVARWRAQSPSASGDGARVQCGEARPDTPVFACHAWLHRECRAPINAARNEMAFEAVRALLGHAP